MIIDCICGLKKFEVEDDQIHHNGRQVKCGVCSKEWFYKPENILEEESQEENPEESPEEDFEDVEEPSTQELLSDEIDLDEEVSIPQTAKERSDTAEKYLLKNKKDGDSKRKRFLIYFLIISIMGLSLLSVPYKRDILSIFPELGWYFEGFAALNNILFK